MTLPPDFCTVAALLHPILPRELHFLAILQNSYQVLPRRAPATADLGTHLGQIHPPNLCSPSIEG
eukprot:COSAG03_NODE_25325_length_266_cov_0.844311_1_plen_64_part_10